MIAPIECVKCGSALPQGAPGEILTCKFCSAETRVPDDVRRAVVSRPTQPANSAVGVAVMAGTLALIAIGVGVAFMAKRPTPPPPPPPVVTAAPLPPPPPKKALMKPSEVGKLADLPEPSWEELDTTEMPSAFANFDALAVLPFATKVATFWAQDARLSDLALTGVTPDGKHDISAHDSWYADYMFLSRAMTNAQEKLKEVGEKKVYTTLCFHAEKGVAKIELGRGGALQSIEGRPPVFECPVPSVVAAFKTANLVPRPSYTVRSRYDRTSQWLWEISADDGHSPDAHVSLAASCKLVR